MNDNHDIDAPNENDRGVLGELAIVLAAFGLIVLVMLLVTFFNWIT